jgi:hypothetical protein
MVTKSDISVNELQQLVKSAMDGKVVEKANVPEKYTHIYEELWKYRKDIYKLRGSIPTDMALEIGDIK